MSFADSIAAFEADVENFITTTEHDIQALIAKIQQGIAVTESHISSALSWVVAHTPQIVTDIEGAITFAGAVGAAANPEVAAAIAAAQAAITALNAVAHAHNSGATDIQTLLAGYTAVKSAAAASASTTAAATASIKVPTVK